MFYIDFEKYICKHSIGDLKYSYIIIMWYLLKFFSVKILWLDEKIIYSWHYFIAMYSTIPFIFHMELE